MTRLSDVVELTFGFAFKSTEFSDQSDDVRLLRGDNVAQGNLRWAGAKRYPASRVDAVDRYKLAVGDVVIAMDRPWIGAGLKYAVVRAQDVPSLLVQRVARLRTKSESLDQGFLSTIIGSAAFTNYVVGVQTGSAVPHISGGQIGDFEFALPPLAEQRAIAATLGAFDDKIESNRQIVKTAPALIRAKITEALLLGGVSTPVSALASFVNGGAYTKGASGTGRMVIRIAELNSGPGGSTVYSGIEVPNEKTARAGDILMSWSGSLGVYRWFRDEAVINQHIFKVIPSNLPAWLVFDRLDAIMPVFRGLAADKATTMGHIQRGHLTSVEVDVPKQSALDKLSPEITSLWDRLLLAEREVLVLERLRDALLPELLAGRISAATESVE